MPLFSPLRWWQARRKQKRLNRAFWNALREPAPHLEKLRALVQAGADMNCNEPYSSQGIPPLAFAARRNHCTVDTVRFLLENGADVARLNEINPPRLTPTLPWAAHGGGRGLDKDEKFHLLFEAGANVNACDEHSGSSVLWELTTWASDALIKSALKRGANPNVPAFGGSVWKPLHLAAYLGRAEVVALYLRYGADPFVLDKNGNTPRMLAETHEPITGSTEDWSYVPDLDECVRLLLAAEQENEG